MARWEAQEAVIRRRDKTYDEDDWEGLAEEMRANISVDHLSEDQKKVFDATMKWFEKARRGGDQLCTLGGFAGTGKSTLTAVLAKAIQSKYSTRDHRIHIAFCAFTGKAANVLRQKLHQTGIHASIIGHPHFGGTIHSLMYKPLVGPDGSVIEWEKKSDLEDYDLIVVDEASMVDDAVLADLESYGVPLLAVGDHGQLPPVKGTGSLMVNPQLRLEQIHRQAADNPIIQLSQHIRETGDVPAMWNNGPNVQFLTFGELQGVLEPLYEQVPVEEIAILTYTNRCRQNMNYQGRCMRNRKAMPAHPVKGDQFICLRNMKGVLFNGMRGILETEPQERGHWYRGTFYFPDDELEVTGDVLKTQLGRERTYNSFDDINRDTDQDFYSWKKVGMLFDYGYALTVHKSQGSQFKHVFLVYERPGRIDADEFRRWLYTGVTRASESVYIVVG